MIYSSGEDGYVQQVNNGDKGKVKRVTRRSSFMAIRPKLLKFLTLDQRVKTDLQIEKATLAWLKFCVIV